MRCHSPLRPTNPTNQHRKGCQAWPAARTWCVHPQRRRLHTIPPLTLPRCHTSLTDSLAHGRYWALAECTFCTMWPPSRYPLSAIHTPCNTTPASPVPHRLRRGTRPRTLIIPPRGLGSYLVPSITYRRRSVCRAPASARPSERPFKFGLHRLTLQGWPPWLASLPSASCPLPHLGRVPATSPLIPCYASHAHGWEYFLPLFTSHRLGD